jgi:hypothetical protein
MKRHEFVDLPRISASSVMSHGHTVRTEKSKHTCHGSEGIVINSRTTSPEAFLNTTVSTYLSRCETKQNDTCRQPRIGVDPPIELPTDAVEECSRIHPLCPIPHASSRLRVIGLSLDENSRAHTRLILQGCREPIDKSLGGEDQGIELPHWLFERLHD